MRLAMVEGDSPAAMLYLTAYTFMLRVNSEALPITVGERPLEPLGENVNSCIGVVKDEIVLRLAKRKNKPHGSTIRRGCTCGKGRRMCPVHVLGKWLASQELGPKPFAHFSADYARLELKRRVAAIGTSDAIHYNLHDFRRGHAQDLVESGCGLQQILGAGEWMSPAFMRYLDTVKIDKEAAVQAHIEESDSEEE